MVKSQCALLTLLVAGAACRSAPTGPYFAPLGQVPAPEQARAQATRIKDPALAAELAWLLGNDRTYARTRLDGGLKATPHKAPLLLRRALLNLTELRSNALVDDLLSLIVHAPKSAEAEVGLVLLHDELERVVHRHKDIERALNASGLANNAPAITAGRVPLVAGLLARIAYRRGEEARAIAHLDRGGFITQMRSIGPLGPADDLEFLKPNRYEASGDWSKRLIYRGRPVQIRAVQSRGLPALSIPAQGPGVYVFDTYFEVSAEGRETSVVLQAQLPSLARVSIDGRWVTQRSRTQGRLKITRLRLSPGWHRLAVTLVGRSGTPFAFALTTPEGHRITLASKSGPLVGRPARAKVAVGADAIDIRADASPWGLVHRLVGKPGHALFGRLLGQRLAQSQWYRDLDRAWWMLGGIRETIPEAASLSFAWARVRAQQGLMAQAQARLRAGLQRDPEHPGARLALARLLQGEQPDAALADAQTVAQLRPDAWQPHALRFDIYRRLGWNAEASTALHAAVALSAPDRVLKAGHRFAINNLRPGLADDLRQRLVARAPRWQASYAAQDAERSGDVASAIAAHIQAATIDEPAHHHTRSAELELARGQPQAAARQAQQALDAAPAHGPALKIALQAAIVAKDSDGAHAILQSIRGLGSTSLEIELLLGDLHDAEGWLADQLAFDPWLGVTPRLPGERAPGQDPANRWAGHQTVGLLDRVVDHVLPTGQVLSWRHSVTRLQTKAATDRAGEISIPPGAQIIALRTLKPDGQTIEADRHEGKEDLSFSALAPGDAVERKWVQIDPPATAWGGYLRRFYFAGQAPLVRSDFAVVVPSTAKVWTHSYHGAPEPTVHTEAGQTTYLWRAENLPPLLPQSHAASLEESVPFVLVTVDLDPATTRAAPLLGTLRYTEGGRQVQQLAHTLTATHATAGAKLGALFRYVLAHIDDGPPRRPEHLLSGQSGERSGLLVALANAVGLEAEVVWAQSGLSPRIQPPYPDPRAFQVRLVRIELPSTRTVWARLSKNRAWLGQLPPHFNGGRFVHLTNMGPTVQDFDGGDVGAWAARSEVTLDVDAHGHARGQVMLSVPAGYAGSLRAYLRSAPPDEAARQLQGLAASLMRGAKLVSHATAALANPLEDLSLILTIEIPFFMTAEGDHLVAEDFFTSPLTMRLLGRPGLGAYLSTTHPQRPLLLRPVTESMRVVLNLPDNVAGTAVVPRTFDLQQPVAAVRQAFKFDPDSHQAVLSMHYHSDLARIAPQDFEAFAASSQTVLQALRNRLVLKLRPQP